MDASTVDRRAGNLPVDTTSFVGRRREVADVKRMLSLSRLVTLTGMGGVGKTRLALRIAGNTRRSFRDGVWFVDLAGLHDAGLVGQTVAANLGLQDQSVSWSSGNLTDFLATRQLLLILDNCEHLVDACASLADSLLRTCPELRIVATSRQPLGIVGEQTVAVPPLSVPGPDGRTSIEGLAQFEAVTMFVERAAAVQPNFVLDASNQVAVAGICRRLDGIPLALELAAGRLRALSADQLLMRLDDRYGLLTGGSRAALPRQQTLRALIDWSFELCSRAEQLLWARLSVFDGFDLEAAEDVCSDEQISADEVLDLLTGLIDKSIVVAQERGSRVRYQLPETLREYGRDRLEECGSTSEFLLRQRNWCHRITAVAETGWFGSGQAELIDRLRIEHGNVRSALSFCLTHPGESDVGLDMASDLRLFWIPSGQANEGRLWLDRLLACQSEPSPTRLRALYVNCHLATGLCDFAIANALLEEAGQVSQRVGDMPGAVAQLRGFGALFRQDAADAANHLTRALTAHRYLGDVGAATFDQLLLAVAMSMLGDDVRATELLDECLAVTESAGECWLRSVALWAAGIEACKHGDPQRAVETQRRSIRLRQAVGAWFLIGTNFDVLAWAAAAVGDGERAGRLLGAAQAIMQSVGSPVISRGPASALHNQYEKSTRDILGEKAFQRAYERGMRLSFDEAVAYALEDRDQPATQSSNAQPAAAVPGSLTRREREVAELIRRGLSNKEISGKLVISKRTAEGHVEHILTKLGFTTRSQVAAWVAEQGVTADSASSSDT